MSLEDNKANLFSFNWFKQKITRLIHLEQMSIEENHEDNAAAANTPFQSDPDFPAFKLNFPEISEEASLINSYFDCIYLLNLKYRTDKRLKSIFQLKKMGIKALIVDGIDGYKEPYKSEYEAYAKIPLYEKDAHPLEFKIKRKCITSPGAWGVLKAKKMILLHALKNKYKRILILQDDLFFIENFHSRFRDFIGNVDNDWKMIALGATQHKWVIPDSLSFRDPEIKIFDPEQKFYHPLVTDGAFAIGIDHSVFQFLIEETDRMNCSFDSGPVRAVYQKYHDKCFVCLPNLIIADVSTSDIREGRNQEDFSVKMHWDLNLYDRDKDFELVSVIMSAFNAERTIEKSIHSILMQTYANFELIIIDDGSTDKTPEIVSGLAELDKRIVFRRNEVNHGCYIARNEALRLSRGKYIAFQDADDISLKTRLEKQLIPLVAGNALVTFSRYLLSHCSPEELDISNQDEMMNLAEYRRIHKNGNYSYPERYNLALATSIYKREIFEKYGLFWESRFGSDMEFLERFLYHESGKSFGSDNTNGHSYVAQTSIIPGVFQFLDDILYLSPEKNESNLSMQYEIHGEARKDFFRNTRSKLTGDYDYKYPVF